MKFFLILAALALIGCECGSHMSVNPDNMIHKVTWPNGSCNGQLRRYWAGQYTYQFGVNCTDGRFVYNLTNFTVE